MFYNALAGIIAIQKMLFFLLFLRCIGGPFYLLAIISVWAEAHVKAGRSTLKRPSMAFRALDAEAHPSGQADMKEREVWAKNPCALVNGGRTCYPLAHLVYKARCS